MAIVWIIGPCKFYYDVSHMEYYSPQEINDISEMLNVFDIRYTDNISNVSYMYGSTREITQFDYQLSFEVYSLYDYFVENIECKTSLSLIDENTIVIEDYQIEITDNDVLLYEEGKATSALHIERKHIYNNYGKEEYSYFWDSIIIKSNGNGTYKVLCGLNRNHFVDEFYYKLREEYFYRSFFSFKTFFFFIK